MTKIRGLCCRELSVLGSHWPAAFLVLLFAPVALPQPAQNASAIRQQMNAKLLLHVPVERELAPGQVDVFTVEAKRGQFAHVAADQKGVAVVVTLAGPDGELLVSADDRIGPFAPEAVSWIAQEPGVYQIRIGKAPNSSETGHYQIELTDLRKPGKADRTRITAESAFFAAVVEEQAGDKDKSLEAIQGYERAASLWRALKDGPEQALCFQKIGIIYYFLGEKQKALDYWGQALVFFRQAGNRAGEASTLNPMGLAYADLGDMQKALDYYGEALPLHRAVGNGVGEANTLNNMGNAYFALGELEKALDNYLQSLRLQRALGARAGEATALGNIGRGYSALGENQKALDSYKQALVLFQATHERVKEAETLDLIGNGYFGLGEMQEALGYYEQALPLLRSVGDRAFEVYTLSNMGTAYRALGDPEKALEFYNQALPLSRAVRDPLAESGILVSLMDYWSGLHNTSLAILFGKEAIDRFQVLRRNIAGLDKDVQQSFVKSKEDYYRELADLLISDGRLSEAQQVLDLLKAHEYSEFTQTRGDAGSVTAPVALTPEEEKSNQEYEQITGDITAIGGQWAELQAKSSRSAEEEKRYDELSDKLTAANQKLQEFLNSLYVSFGKGNQANARVETIDEESAGLQTLVEDLGAGTVAVYTLVLDDKCVLMVITPATRVAREMPVSKSELHRKVFAFQSALSGHESDEDIRTKGQELYKILVAPIEEDLKGAQAKTIVWSLDDVLRYVPMAALYDGKQYLVERYASVVITTASIGNLKDQPHVSNWRGVAMGVSKDYDGLGVLKAVPDELDSVVRSDATVGSHGPVTGTILLDDSFTEKSMESALEKHPPLVHIASHYVYEPGNDNNSYLLLGGKDTGGQGFRLTLADLRDDQRLDFKGIELLTLSGCETALGGSKDSDGREIDALGVTAQKKGAKAVVATLWQVDDTSVGLLMANFYKLWITTTGITKVEALQQAQLAILHGTAGSSGAPESSSANASKQQSENSQYANPYYWAPFILIGNWK
jgi:CHAT domain-containing protein/tetratricopeptide (TPR) repeat protein